MALGIPAAYLGLMVSGDIGGITIYTDRYGRKIAYPKSPPKKPPTELQTAVRSRFKAAQAEYMTLSPAQKADYETLVRHASLALTGQNLFIHVAMKHTGAMLATLVLQTGIEVPQPTPV